MPTHLKALIERFFDAVQRKDMNAVLACFADDAVFFDPHYPTPRMTGRDGIRAGLEWGFNFVDKFGFTVVNSFERADGNAAAVEVATAHVLPDGTPMNFPQLFVFETDGGLIERLQSYVPYGPAGAATAAAAPSLRSRVA